MSEVLQRTKVRAPFWRSDSLSCHGEATALVLGSERVSHRDLARRVAAQASGWPGVGERRLVLVEIEHTVESVVTYLAALDAGHVVLLAAPGRAQDLASTWAPDDVAGTGARGWTVTHGSVPGRHDLHPDLALLLSTSGSTGSPKLVRLSAHAVVANALDIAKALDLDVTDRGVTTLPLHYCYGLSVLHSHLAVGASVLLTDASVVEPALWTSMRAAGVTSLAGVPHTFDLLASSAAPTASVPSLRVVTQAGGRLDPAQVRDWAERGHREGWDLRVMYGQTEATARMTVSSAGQADDEPSTVGLPVGSGRIHIRGATGEVPPGEVGEVHFTGANVMLGYALDPQDLARGRDVETLATGDLGRQRPDGSLEIVGRRASFLKINGVRVDVERVEALLADAGLETLVGGSDERLLALVVGEGATAGAGRLRDRATSAMMAATGLPAHRVDAVIVPAVPRHANGKPDRGAVEPTVDALAGAKDRAAPGSGSSAAELVALYAELLARPHATADDTFVDLGGDSLSYVELSVHLEERLGPLPADWPLRPISALARSDSPAQRWFAAVDTTIVLRALAILAIVGSHTHVFHLLGGAHILLAVAGYNFARFAATAPTVREMWRRVGSTVGRIAAPTAVWVTVVGLFAGTYSVANVFLVNWLFGSESWSSTWRLWFLEALVWTVVGFAAVLSIPAVRWRYARSPFALAAAVAALGALARLDILGLTSPPGRGTAPAVLWLVAIGWAAHVAASRRQRLLLSGIVVLTLPGFMGDPVREATIAAGLLLLVWVRTLSVPRPAVHAIAVLASASLYIYLTHFEVYRATNVPLVNLALGTGVGLLAWLLTTRVTAWLGTLRTRPPKQPPSTSPARRRTPTPSQEISS
ncbi:MAG: AMP-binding protein [Ornithinibacter sp.]